MADSARIDPSWPPTLREAADRLDEHASCIDPGGDTGTIALAADVRRISHLIDDQLTAAIHRLDTEVRAAAARPGQ